MKKIVPHNDALAHLKTFTDARIAIGRVGGSMSTSELLSFRLDQARARDAVHTQFQPEALADKFVDLGLGLDILQIDSKAIDRVSFLKNPGLGRKINDADREKLLMYAKSHAAADVILLVSDGLSASAVEKNACDLLQALTPILRDKAFNVGPIVIARHARVAIQDEVGAILGARLAVILIGERPGLTSTDSMSAYLVYEPCIGKSDADRNCISNIRASGFPPKHAAVKLADLIQRCFTAKLSGVSVKDGDSEHFIGP